MKTLFLCQYSTGSFEDWKELNCFVTDDKDKAIKWVAKFNNLKTKGVDHYNYMVDKFGHYEGVFDWYNFNLAYFLEIPFK